MKQQTPRAIFLHSRHFFACPDMPQTGYQRGRMLAHRNARASGGRCPKAHKECGACGACCKLLRVGPGHRHHGFHLNKSCTRCGVVYYCDRTCQKAAWPLHKHECVPIAQDDEGDEGDGESDGEQKEGGDDDQDEGGERRDGASMLRAMVSRAEEQGQYCIF